jgi:hypothetical protein
VIGGVEAVHESFQAILEEGRRRWRFEIEGAQVEFIFLVVLSFVFLNTC